MTIVPNNLKTTSARAVPPQVAPNALIVVPCYNEAERLCVTSFLTYMDTSPAVSFVFVNDGSSDATLDRLADLQNRRPNRIHVLSLSQNSGKAEAVRQGLLYASGLGVELMGYWDADLATPLDSIDDFARVANKLTGVTVIFGSRRALLGHRIERTMKRRLVSRLCALLARQAVRLPVGDTQCGAKLLRNTATVRNAIATPFSAGWLFDVELFARISKDTTERGVFYEQPLCEWNEVAGSKVSGAAILKSGLCMLRLIAQIRLGLPTASPSQTDLPVAHVICVDDDSSLAMVA